MGVSENMGALVAAEEYAAEQERLGELMRQVKGCRPSVSHKWPLLALSYCVRMMSYPAGFSPPPTCGCLQGFLSLARSRLHVGRGWSGPEDCRTEIEPTVTLVTERWDASGGTRQCSITCSDTFCVSDHLLPFWSNLVPDG